MSPESFKISLKRPCSIGQNLLNSTSLKFHLSSIRFRDICKKKLTGEYYVPLHKDLPKRIVDKTSNIDISQTIRDIFKFIGRTYSAYDS